MPVQKKHPYLIFHQKHKLNLSLVSWTLVSNVILRKNEHSTRVKAFIGSTGNCDEHVGRFLNWFRVLPHHTESSSQIHKFSRGMRIMLLIRDRKRSYPDQRVRPGPQESRDISRPETLLWGFHQQVFSISRKNASKTTERVSPVQDVYDIAWYFKVCSAF